MRTDITDDGLRVGAGFAKVSAIQAFLGKVQFCSSFLRRQKRFSTVRRAGQSSAVALNGMKALDPSFRWDDDQKLIHQTSPGPARSYDALAAKPARKRFFSALRALRAALRSLRSWPHR